MKDAKILEEVAKLIKDKQFNHNLHQKLFFSLHYLYDVSHETECLTPVLEHTIKLMTLLEVYFSVPLSSDACSTFFHNKVFTKIEETASSLLFYLDAFLDLQKVNAENE